ncbi:hypothetical protein B566_EDAN013596 [Ephemera danica]|nr:hypothetical protein B566_EDAN013596 [Ephemera danica]
MSGESRYTNDDQIRYVATWFAEWSEMQRGDFVAVLAQSFASTSCQLNGIADMSLRPPSLFQCRIKLFREWAVGWGPTERAQFIERLAAIDSEFVEQYEQALKVMEGGNKVSSAIPSALVSTDPREGEVV